MTRPRLVIGNWKMNPPTVAEALVLARSTARIEAARVEVGVAPPWVALAAVVDALADSAVRVYGQDVHWEEKGAFTGQTAASMLRGAAFGAIIGHSEVRRYQGDDDARIARKVARAIEEGLQVVLCVGESEERYAAGETHEVIARQIAADLSAAPVGAPVVVAYEPVWAIGTGRPATGAHAAEAAAVIRDAMMSAGRDGDATPILYGGSVSADSVGEVASAPGIDGALVGGASLRVDEFASIVRAFR